MFDLDVVRRILEKESELQERQRELLSEALVFLERLANQEYVSEDEKEDFEFDLKSILEEMDLDVDYYEE